MTCTCMAWELTGIPYPHAICCINWLSPDPAKFVDDYLTTKRYLEAYGKPLQP